MENNETKVKELMDEFGSLLSEYKDVCVRLRKMKSCGAPDSKQGELFGEEYTLRKRLIKLVDRICDLPDSDKETLNTSELAYKVAEIMLEIMLEMPFLPAGLWGGLVAWVKYVRDYLAADGEPRALGEE